MLADVCGTFLICTGVLLNENGENIDNKSLSTCCQVFLHSKLDRFPLLRFRFILLNLILIIRMILWNILILLLLTSLSHLCLHLLEISC